MPRPCLPVLSATSCSTHRPKLDDRVADDERQLVAAVPRELAEREPEPQAGVGLASSRSARTPARPPRRARAARAPARRSAPPARARTATAPSSARRCSGRSRSSRGSRARAASVEQRAAGVGDRDEAAAVAAPASGSARTARASRSCRRTWSRRRTACARGRSARCTARIAAGSVESSTCSASASAGRAEGAPEHLGREARAAHPEQHGVGQPVGGAAARELDELVGALEHRVGDRQPAEPVADLRRRPGRPTATRPWPTRGARRRCSTAVATRAAIALESSRVDRRGDRRRAPGERPPGARSRSRRAACSSASTNAVDARLAAASR